MLAAILLPLLFQAPTITPQSWEFPDHDLEISLEGGLVHVHDAKVDDSQTLHGWKFAHGDHKLSMRLVVVPRQAWGLQDPFDVMQNIAYNRRKDPDQAAFRFETEDVLRGPYGTVPYAAFATSALFDVTERIGTEYYMASLTEDRGWSLRMTCHPAPDAETKKAIRTFLEKGVRFIGETESLEWTAEEAQARWEKDKPDELKGDLEILRPSISGKG